MLPKRLAQVICFRFSFRFPCKLLFFRKCREANEKLTMKLNETLADYANVVPRRHYELLETEYEVRSIHSRFTFQYSLTNRVLSPLILFPNILILPVDKSGLLELNICLKQQTFIARFLQLSISRFNILGEVVLLKYLF